MHAVARKVIDEKLMAGSEFGKKMQAGFGISDPR